MIAHSLFGVSLNVADLKKAEFFYTEALGFERDGRLAKIIGDHAALLGAQSIEVAPLRRGKQKLHLCRCDPLGAAYPLPAASNDLVFQHCALNSMSIEKDYARLKAHGAQPISRHGPEKLSEGLFAFKFRDPEGHPLELIQLKDKNDVTLGGIDHTAIVVEDADKSIAFYEERLGLRVQSRQTNQGPSQDHLDDLHEPIVDVVGLIPEIASPHLELLGYRQPISKATRPWALSDRAATRAMFLVDELPAGLGGIKRPNGDGVAVIRDPDGHILQLLTMKAPETKV